MLSGSKRFYKNKAGMFLAFFFAVVWSGCVKQNIPEPVVVDPDPLIPDEYYQALRAYKKSDHPIMFGWVGGLSGSTKAGRGNGSWDLPDSLDLVSLWGGLPPFDSQNYKEIQAVRAKKGTRFLWCVFGSDIEALIRKNFPELIKTDIMRAIESTAKSIADTINRYQLDGFDLDYEPDFGDLSIFGDQNSNGYVTNDPHTQRLFQALSRYLGPQSGNGKLLIIDGQFDVGIEPYINYLMQQAYGASTTFQLQSRYNDYGGGVLPSKKFVPTESYEMHKNQGTGSLELMAVWNATQGQKGGVGAYHLEYDFASNPLYPYERIRKCIQLMNPSGH